MKNTYIEPSDNTNEMTFSQLQRYWAKHPNATPIVFDNVINQTNTMEQEEKVQTKVCKACGRELPVSQFGKHARTKDGYQPICKECKSEKAKKSRWKMEEAASGKRQAPKSGLEDVDTAAILAELRRRGYNGTLTYTQTVEI